MHYDNCFFFFDLCYTFFNPAGQQIDRADHNSLGGDK